MDIFSAMKITHSALSAERLRMDIVASNIANMNTTRSASGQPYRRQHAVFRAAEDSSKFESMLNGGSPSMQFQGVEVAGIAQDNAPPKMVYDPESPEADGQGYVAYPNIDLIKEMVDMMSASRSYQANVTVFNSVKAMALKALDIGKA